jgi:histone-lysine N-methyltransferase SUV39H
MLFALGKIMGFLWQLTKEKLPCISVLSLSPVIAAKLISVNSRLRPRLTLTNEWTKIAQATGASPITFVNEEDGEEVPPLVDDFQYLEKGYI